MCKGVREIRSLGQAGKIVRIEQWQRLNEIVTKTDFGFSKKLFRSSLALLLCATAMSTTLSGCSKTFEQRMKEAEEAEKMGDSELSEEIYTDLIDRAKKEKNLKHQQSAMTALAIEYWLQRRYDEVRPVLEEIMKLDYPEKATEFEKIKQFMKFGRQQVHALLVHKEFETAETLLKLMISLHVQTLQVKDPEYVVLLEDLADTYYDRGNWKKAKEAYNTALVKIEVTQGPDVIYEKMKLIDTFERFTECCIKTNDPDTGITLISRWLQSKVDMERKILKAIKDKERSERRKVKVISGPAELKKIKDYPKAPGTAIVALYTLLGDLYQVKGNKFNAQDAYRHAVAIYPDYERAVQGLSKLTK